MIRRILRDKKNVWLWKCPDDQRLLMVTAPERRKLCRIIQPWIEECDASVYLNDKGAGIDPPFPIWFVRFDEISLPMSLMITQEPERVKVVQHF